MFVNLENDHLDPSNKIYRVIWNKIRIKVRTNRRGRLWHQGVVVITTTQLHSTKPELMLCAGSNYAHRMSAIHDGEDL